MSNVQAIGDLAGLTAVERGAIIGWLIEHNKRIDLVKTQFEQIFGKRVSAKAVKTLLIKNEKEINEEREKWLACPEKQELYHLTERLKRWQSLYELSQKDDAIIINAKYGKDSWDVEKKKDVKGGAIVLKAAAWDVHTHKKLELEAKKLAAMHPPEDEDMGMDDDAVVKFA